ncbi:MAG: 4-hydroxythreonine-4-phosphate dehydrogenase PdxA [bacterium]
MKRILVSAGEAAGANLRLLSAAALKNPSVKFDLVSDEKATNDYCRETKTILPKNISMIQTERRNFKITPGRPDRESGLLAYESLKRSVDIIEKKKKDYLGLLTLPVIKSSVSLYCRGFRGHTEYLEKRDGREAAMLLYSKKISVAPITTHISVSDVESMINYQNIYPKIAAVQEFYRKRLKKTPKFAILCLNPHCSDRGLLGKADEKILKIAEKLKKDFDVSSPLCADSAFTEENMKKYDVFFGMYHDQVLIPFKMLSFNNGVNVTCGLSYLRVSPDHGPACDKVFSNDLSAGSTLESVKLLLKTAKK